MEIPCVSTTITGIPRAHSERERRNIVEPANEDQLAGALARLIEDPDLREQFRPCGPPARQGKLRFASECCEAGGDVSVPVITSQELQVQVKQSKRHDLSVIGRPDADILRRCLQHLKECADGLSVELRGG